jgi:hypothetical protein
VRNVGCTRRGYRFPFVPWHLLLMGTQVEADLPLDHAIHQQAHDCEHCQGRNPFGFLEPHGADRRRIFDPTKAWFHSRVLLLIGLENLSIRTALATHGGRQDSPPVFLFRDDQGLHLDDEAIARFHW